MDTIWIILSLSHKLRWCFPTWSHPFRAISPQRWVQQKRFRGLVEFPLPPSPLHAVYRVRVDCLPMLIYTEELETAVVTWSLLENLQCQIYSKRMSNKGDFTVKIGDFVGETWWFKVKVSSRWVLRMNKLLIWWISWETWGLPLLTNVEKKRERNIKLVKYDHKIKWMSQLSQFGLQYHLFTYFFSTDWRHFLICGGWARP